MVIRTGISLLNHGVNLLLGELLTDRGHDVSQLGGRDETVTVSIKDPEGLSNLLFRISVLHLSGNLFVYFFKP